MIETISFNNQTYPLFQSQGFAAKFCFPFAHQVCYGKGVDIGCNRKEWAYFDKYGCPALMIDPVISSDFDAYRLPPGKFDYIFSSHSVEHYPDWVKALDYWKTKLYKNGVLFLYLPDYSQHYWRPWHNRKHVHMFTPEVIKDYLTDRKWANIFVSGVDLNHSFIAMASNTENK